VGYQKEMGSKLTEASQSSKGRVIKAQEEGGTVGKRGRPCDPT